MAVYLYWFLLAALLIAMEMATGTFYLLMLGVAMMVGGLAALLGVPLAGQFTVSAVAVVAGTIMLRRWKGSHPQKPADGNLDIGQPVKVLKWNSDGTARVFYRGAEWDADADGAELPRDEVLYIKAMRGSTLILTSRKP